jgi:hypothetical protein
MTDETQRKAVLAAVMAVKRGFIDPESAVGLLGDIWKTGDEFQAAAPTHPGPTTPDPIATLSKMNPTAPVHGLTLELDAMLQSERTMAGACEKLGISAGLQAALESMSLGKPQGVNDTRKALTEIARQRVDDMRSHLPVTGDERYSVVREVARGGMGRILLAMDNAVGREIALKEVLGAHEGSHPDVSLADPVAVERFLREAKVTGQLDHPNIVPVYEISRRENGSVFYTMKLVRGESMAERLAAIDAATFCSLRNTSIILGQAPMISPKRLSSSSALSFSLSARRALSNMAFCRIREACPAKIVSKSSC